MTSSTKALRLPPMLKVGDIIRLYGLSARKALSQNFILDLNVTDKMARCADVFDCHVVEVGSGPGSFTRSILNQGVRHLHAVEIDKRFIPTLEMLQEAAAGHLSVHNNDILRMDIDSVLHEPISAPWDSDDLPNIRLVGNLPFNVSIPLILQWLEGLSEQRGPWRHGRVPMTLVFQKEVGQNMLAPPNNKHRNRITTMTQNYCHVTRPMVLNSSVFTPQPKIDAWMMHFVPRQKPLIDAPFDVLEQVVKAVFAMKGKHISKSVKLLFPEDEKLGPELISLAEVPYYLRAHQLSFEDFNRITDSFLELCARHELSTCPQRINKPSRLVDGLDDDIRAIET